MMNSLTDSRKIIPKIAEKENNPQQIYEGDNFQNNNNLNEYKNSNNQIYNVKDNTQYYNPNLIHNSARSITYQLKRNIPMNCYYQTEDIETIEKEEKRCKEEIPKDIKDELIFKSYENKLEELKKKIKKLNNENINLNNEIQKQINEKEIAVKIANAAEEDALLIREIIKKLNLNDDDNLIENILVMVKNTNNQDEQIRKELIEKLNQLYIDLVCPNINSGNQNFDTLWDWITSLIITRKELKSQRNIEKDKNEKRENDTDLYQNILNEIRKVYKDVNNIDDVRNFLKNLVQSEIINKKRNHKIKKTLFKDKVEDKE